MHDGGLASHADGLTSRSVSSFAGALSACAEDVCISSSAHVEQCLVDEPHVQHSARRRSPLHLPAARWLHGAGDGGRGAGTVAAARVPLAAERPGYISTSLRSPYHVHADVCIDSRPGPPAIVHAGTPQAQRAVAADETAPGCFIGGRTVRGDEGPPDGRQARQAGAQPTPLSGRPTRAVTLVHTPSSHTPIALPSLMRAVPCILLGSAPRAFLVHPHMYVYPSSSVLI